MTDDDEIRALSDEVVRTRLALHRKAEPEARAYAAAQEALAAALRAQDFEDGRLRLRADHLADLRPTSTIIFHARPDGEPPRPRHRRARWWE